MHLYSFVFGRFIRPGCAHFWCFVPLQLSTRAGLVQFIAALVSCFTLLLMVVILLLTTFSPLIVYIKIVTAAMSFSKQIVFLAFDTATFSTLNFFWKQRALCVFFLFRLNCQYLLEHSFFYTNTVQVV